jgi:hypothetical protein
MEKEKFSSASLDQNSRRTFKEESRFLSRREDETRKKLFSIICTGCKNKHVQSGVHPLDLFNLRHIYL